MMKNQTKESYMRKEIKILIESLIVSLTLIVSILVYFIIKGYFLTKTYVPDIINEYKESEVLSSSVSFGRIKPFDWTDYLIIFLLIFIFYLLIRLGFAKIKHFKESK